MPEPIISPEMADLRGDLDNIVAEIEAKAPYGAVWLSTRQGLNIRVDNREENVSTVPPSTGTVLTAYDGNTVYEKAIPGLDRSAVQRGARELIAGVSFSTGEAIDPGPHRQGNFAGAEKDRADKLTIQEKLDRVRELHRRLQGRDQRVVNVQVGYREMGETSVFRNRVADLAQHVQRLQLFVVIVAAGSNGVRYDLASKCTGNGWDDLTFSDAELQAVIDNTIALNEAERIEPGEYTIVTAPGVTGTICHESFGHGVETDMFLKDRALAAHYIDREVGSSLVNIYDDPSIPGAYASYYFDDEGVLAKPAQIVENGIFRRGITDMYSAHALKFARTANGRRQDYSRKAYARMSNTFFGSGTTPVADLFAQVENGIYLEKWSSGMEDPQGWGIQVTCRFGHEIKNGKVTGRMFAPIGITGYVPDVLQSVTAVGNDWEIDAGTCGKGHKEFVPVCSGGPHLLMKARLG